ncbi:hypothetical protein ACLB2K_011193 [Fragaria x ananassa]
MQTHHTISWFSQFTLLSVLLLLLFFKIASGFGLMGPISASFGESGFFCAIDASSKQEVSISNIVFKRVVSGEGFSCGGIREGGLVCWGPNSANLGVSDVLDNFTALASGKDSLCGISEVTGQVQCWGDADLLDCIIPIRDRQSQNKFLYCNGQLFDVRCAANVINMMVQDTLEALGEMTAKIRGSIRYVKSSQAIQSKFDEIAQEVGIQVERCIGLDNPLQWNSTYAMVEIALEYRAVFALLQENDPVYTMCPSDIEWDRATVITTYLKHFVEMTNAFTRFKSPTANLYFHEICSLYEQLKEWCKNPDDYISSLAFKMRSKFEEYWQRCSLGLAVVAVLDPRLSVGGSTVEC